MTVREAPVRRALAALVLLFALVAGATACSSDSASPVDTAAPTTTVAADPNLVVVATAKNAELEVLAAPPAGVDIPPSTATTVAPPKTLPAIPRTGLNSAGSRKTADGWAFSNPTYFENPLVMVVTARSGDWLRVMVHARPNGMEGYVRADQVELTTTRYRMDLDLAKRHLKVFDGDELIVETDVVIGKDATPTPVGQFFINELIPQSNPGGTYGPWVLSTSAYSETLDTFDGGLPVVAFHGTNQPDLIGTQASNGCIRMPNDVVTKLAEIIPAGTLVNIVAGDTAATSAAAA